MFERFTDKGRAVLVRARELGEERKSPFLRRHHMLIALLDHAETTPEGIVAVALDDAAVSRDAFRSALIESLTTSEHPSDESGGIPFSSGGKKALELSLREALSLGHNYIGTEHLMLAILRSADGPLEEVIDASGLKYGRARDLVRERSSDRERGRARRGGGGGRYRGVKMRAASQGLDAVVQATFARAGRDRDATTGDLFVALAETPDTHFAAMLGDVSLPTRDTLAAHADRLVAAKAPDGVVAQPIKVDSRTGEVTITDPGLASAIRDAVARSGSADVVSDALRALRSDDA